MAEPKVAPEYLRVTEMFEPFSTVPPPPRDTLAEPAKASWVPAKQNTESTIIIIVKAGTAALSFNFVRLFSISACPS